MYKFFFYNFVNTYLYLNISLMSFFYFFTEPVAGKNQITKTESISEDLYIIYKKYKFLFIDPTMDDQL